MDELLATVGNILSGLNGYAPEFVGSLVAIKAAAFHAGFISAWAVFGILAPLLIVFSVFFARCEWEGEGWLCGIIITSVLFATDIGIIITLYVRLAMFKAAPLAYVIQGLLSQ